MDRIRRHGGVLAAIAAGGVVGAEARYALGLLDSGVPGRLWLTLGENVSGCLLIGVFMAVLLELTAPHRLVRPFLGVGVLGGYTTFSAYAVDVQRLLVDDRAGLAAAYLVTTPVAALLAVWAGAEGTRAFVERRRHRGGGS